MNAQLINIGDEILIGQIVNTNASWMAAFLNQNGIDVSKIISISDKKESIVDTLTSSLTEADLLLFTGGLGPTKDDITKKTLSEYFGMELLYHQATFDNITELFKQFGKIPDDRYKYQSYMPAGAEILINKTGTASGMWFNHEGKIIVSMPGVPKEMKFLMEHEVLPKLRQQKNLIHIEHETVLTFGKGETDLSELLEEFEKELPEHIGLAYLPDTTTAYVRLRLTAKSKKAQGLKEDLNLQVQKLIKILGYLHIGNEKEKIEFQIGKLLLKENSTLGTAESCTGGNIAHKITSVPGSSKYYFGSFVAYHNDIKINILNVNPDTIAQNGAVSEQTVYEMAENAKKMLRVDYLLAISGIAGPEGGSEEKPVGTFFIALAHPNGILTKKIQLGNNRDRNIEIISTIALNTLRLFLLEKFNP
jgi:nicotinamide-nucleotide amidase